MNQSRKNITLAFSVTEEEAADLDRAAEHNGISRSAFTRRAVLVLCQASLGEDLSSEYRWQPRRDRRVFVR